MDRNQQLRSSKVSMRSAGDLEAEWECVNNATLPHGNSLIYNVMIFTSVSGSVVIANANEESSTSVVHDGCKGPPQLGAVIMTIYPFVVRNTINPGDANFTKERWVRDIQEQLAAQIHPAPCDLYARTVAAKREAHVITGSDILSAVSALLNQNGGSNNLASSQLITKSGMSVRFELAISTTLSKALLPYDNEYISTDTDDESFDNTDSSGIGSVEDDECPSTPLPTPPSTNTCPSSISRARRLCTAVGVVGMVIVALWFRTKCTS